MSNTPRYKKISLEVVVFFLVPTLLEIICFILTADAKFLIAAVICFLVGIIRNTGEMNARRIVTNILGRSMALMLILFFMFSMPTLTIRSRMIWQYPFQKFYTGLYQNVKEPDWFPDFRDDVQSDYYFEYIPSLMQGTGHYSVCFITSPETAAEYENKFASQAQYIIPFEEYAAASDRYTIGDEKDDSGNNALDVYWEKIFWRNGAEPATQIYVLDAVLNFNHPHSSAVIIDRERGRIQLSRLG
ncbi:MAG: hypothetical protein J1F11_11960 [Oscillospiraceae bacterium]|nr:hypothetical protein [Oscillospiraceae bacterium]